MSDVESQSVPSAAGSPSEPQSLAPVAQSKRIDAMDILRGLAIAGILLMNIEWFSRSMSSMSTFDASMTGLDHATGWLIRCFVEGKFYKLFALLFGMGFAVMLIRAREVGRPFGAWFSRRMLVLLVIGLLHMVFLWGGDILHDYAFSGLLLLGWIFLLKRKRFQKYDNPRSFLKLALVWLAFPIVMAAIAGIGYGVSFNSSKLAEAWQKQTTIAAKVTTQWDSMSEEEKVSPPEIDDAEIVDVVESQADEEAEDETELTDEEKMDQSVENAIKRKQKKGKGTKEEIEAFTQYSYWQATLFRIKFTGFMLVLTPFISLAILLPIFLLGYWLISSGTIKNHKENGHIFKPMAWIGMTFGLVTSVGSLLLLQHPVAKIPGVLQGVGQILFLMSQYLLAAGYLGVTIRLLNTETWSKRLGKFAPMGRMALTNYIMHSVILTTIFYGYAGGLYGQISRAPQMGIVVAIIVFQMIFSSWWLTRYQFGPLEWLWRSLTYKKRQPMRITG
jgi:uncharacterized protein